MPGRVVEAFILQVRPYGEADLIVDFFTSEAGRMRGIAKGAKKSKRRFVHCLETLNRVRLNLFEKQNLSLARIDQGELIDPFPGIRTDFKKWGQASYCCEMVKELFAVGDCNPPVFTLLGESLKVLEQETGEQNIIAIFQIRLLHLAGYALYLQDCLGCGRKFEEIAVPLFSVSRGGVFCADCLRGEKGLRLSQGAIRSILQSMAMKLPEVFRLRFSRDIHSDIDRILEPFSNRVMGKELGSARYLKQIQEPYG
jgi:DNA repair protein RecO (recombination protein O)